MQAAQIFAQMRPTRQSYTETFTVAGVGDDTVNLIYGSELIIAVPCSRSYFDRSRGDEVKVLVSPGSMFVLGKAGTAFTGDVDWSSVTGKPDMPGVQWGESDPAGTGWTQGVASGVFVKDNQLYVKTAAGSGSGGSAGGAGRPDPVVVDPTADALYQGGHRSTAINGGNPVQGSWPGYPANMGLWCYGSRAADAVAGKVLDTVTVRLARRNRGGLRGNVPVHLYLVDAGSPPNGTPSLGQRWNPDPGGGLQRAEVYHLTGSNSVTMPGDFAAEFVTGGKALAAYAGAGDDYIIFGSGCGQVRFTFKEA